MFCLASVATTARPKAIRDSARQLGVPVAHRWIELHRNTTMDGDAEHILGCMHGCYSCALLGVRDRSLELRLRRAGRRLSKRQMFGFDPRSEAPPANIPEPCSQGHENRRGKNVCARCSERLSHSSKYWIWHAALVSSHVCECFGLKTGGRYHDLLSWIHKMRPYPPTHQYETDEHFESLYAVTHMVYTLSNYGTRRVSPRLLKPEVRHLHASLDSAIELGHCDAVGEIVAALMALGFDGRTRLIRRGWEFLVEAQRENGSWSDPQTDDCTGWHPTWAAIDALRGYTWRGSEAKPSISPC